jgi:nitroreductase
MEFEDVVRGRHMVRSFEDTSVAIEVVDRMIDRARRSPSAGYSQGVDFVVLQGADETERFWAVPAIRSYWDSVFPGVRRAPVLVLPIADRDAYLRRYSEPDKAPAGLQAASAWPVPYWLTDTAMATMVLLLAAVDEGLGALLFGLFRGTDVEVLERLGVPEGHDLIGAVAIGYPADDRPSGSAATRPRRPLSDVIHRGGW